MNLEARLRILVTRALAGMGDLRGDIVVIGGLAKFFYQLDPAFGELQFPPRATVDLDVALGLKAAARTGPLHDQLTQENLVAYRVRDESGEVIEQRYQLREDGADQLVATGLEIAVPYQGKRPTKPRGKQAALLPSAVRFVGLLLIDPITVTDPELGQLRLPHPFAYAVQKTLIRERRQETDKRASDQVDVVFTIWHYQSAWRERRAFRARAAGLTPGNRRWIADAEKRWRTLYQDSASEGSQEVARTIAQSGVTPDVVSRVMLDFIKTVASA